MLLCDTILKKDDRNFHCWNYRSNIFDLIKNFFPDCFSKFVEKEFEFTLNMIKKNFSNFSAWHYRSKIIPLILKEQNSSFCDTEKIIDFLKEDLEFIKNAFYTDHKDQSIWNYHYWILNNITPVYVESIEFVNSESKENSDNKENTFTLNIKLSTIMKVQGYLGVTSESNNVTGHISSGNKKEFSDVVTIRLDNFKDNDIVYFKANNSRSDCKESKDKLDNPCFSKINLELNPFKIKKIDGKYTFEEITLNEGMINKRVLLEKFLNDQLTLIEELIVCLGKSEVFTEFGHFRIAQIKLLILNIFYNHNFERKGDEVEKQKKLIKEIIEEYRLLKENKSLRMKVMYQNLYDNFTKQMESKL